MTWRLVLPAALLVLAVPATRHVATRPEQALRALPLEDAPPLLDDGDLPSLRQALDESKRWFASQPPHRTMMYGPRKVTAHEMAVALDRFETLLLDDPSPAVLSSRMSAEFDLFESTGGETGATLITGYDDPLIDASLTRTKEYAAPIYAEPDDLVHTGHRKAARRDESGALVPYWTRAEINDGKMGKHAAVLAWARDPVDVYFAQVEGSATLKLPDGSQKRIGNAGLNGRVYRSVGRELIDAGKIPRERMSIQAIRAWLDAHPDEKRKDLDHDLSYVFFRWLDGPPLGVLGRPLTPGRSIATDTRLFPRGGLAFVSTTRPIESESGVVATDGSYAVAPLNRFVFNQDTGGAIRGAGRVDFFWGPGAYAEFASGEMQQTGRLLFLVPKQVPAGPH
jgi:membrane-bound lytic murein transglycosylase A